MELPKELNFNPWSDNEINSLSKTRDGYYKYWKNTHDRSYYLSYSDKQNSITPNFIIKSNNSASETSEISKLLNHFFTDIKSNSVSDLLTSTTSINETFNELSNMCPFSKLKEKTFDFHLISVDSVVKLISNLNPNNGPGISDISSR
ncbi:hypothetical protein BpHYR1_022122 [Brachionus plicatilis]|uniref:Uncharacterized protein n=1 Tax=Brachionus plicatilis TaxID=10195 RepID=A0A3M7SEL5_BRAPC|nr:hypothetical protein BpHYR1_022122 [Brachionus plicatilis]